MKALVTGGAGFIGSHVADSLIEKGYAVVILDNLSSGKIENVNKKAIFVKASVNDDLTGLFEREKFDYVFHLAAQINVRTSIKEPREDACVNILGTLNILNNCAKYGVKKIIFSSTGGAIYGDNVKIPTSETEEQNPASPYGIAKLTIEKYLKFYKDIYGLDYAVLRYSNVYGPRQNFKGEAGVVAIFIDKILKNEPLIINGSGEQTRDYVFVKDVADANILALELSGTFNVSTGKETNVNEISMKIKELMNSSLNEVHGIEIKGEIMRSCLDARKLIKEGWMPKYDLERGLMETVGWFKGILVTD